MDLTNLEQLYAKNQELDKALEKIQEEQKKIEEMDRKLKVQKWNKMFDDLKMLKKYVAPRHVLNTGFQTEDNLVYGFTFQQDEVMFVKASEQNGKAVTENFLFPIIKESPYCMAEPFLTQWQCNRSYLKKLFYIIENWELALHHIQQNLVDELKGNIQEKISRLEKKEIELEKKIGKIV